MKILFSLMVHYGLEKLTLIFLHFSTSDIYRVHNLSSDHSQSHRTLWFQAPVYSCIKLLTYRVQFYSVTQSCPTIYDPMNCSMPGLPVHHQLPEYTQTQVHWVSDAIQPSHPLSSPSPPALYLSQHQGLFKWVNSSHELTHDAWGGQNIGVSPSTSVLPMNTQDWSPWGWTGWISLQSKGLSSLLHTTV